MTKKIAIYPGTFDPITNGHVDIIGRAANLFDEIIVGIATSKRKQPYFTLDIRLKLAKEALKKFANVKVAAIDALLVDFAKEHSANIILRGLRAVSDFDYEFQLAGMNRQLAPEIETIFLPASVEFSAISSTMIREILDLGGDISLFVPKGVSEHLE